MVDPDDEERAGPGWVDLREKPPEPLAPAPVALGVWELAWPTIVAFGAQTLVRFADFAMVGSLGPDALAAVGLGGQVYWLVQALANLVPTGLAAILARAVGARDPALADAVLRQSLLLATLLAAVTTVLGLPFTDFAIAIYGVEPTVVALGSDYVYWLLWGTIPFSLGFVFGAALRAAGDSRTPLYVGIFTNLLNVLLNWVLIHGHLGAPALGVAGAAIASSLSMVVQLVVFGWLWRARRLALEPGPGSFRPDPALWRRIAVIGYPASIEQGLFQVGLLGFQRIMSLYGTAAIAAYNVGAQILSFSFIPGIGFATAAGTLVGQHLGEGTPAAAARSGWRATAGAVASMTVIGAVIIASAEPLARIFTDDAQVIALTVDFIWILGLVQPLMAVEFALGGSLRGAGDTVFPMGTVFVGLFLVRLVPATAASLWLDVPVQVIWCALISDYAVKAALLVGRFRGGRWASRQV
ncbi:MAG: MATE family efflux transporter [Myxococcota bacterium]